MIEVKFAFLDSLIMEEYAYDIKVKKYLMEALTYIAFMATDTETLLIHCLMDSLENLIVSY
jgi:protein-tyrosine phosphatase